MADKTLAEVKKSLGTEKVHEVDTAFLVNDFGKYCPNVTFVVPKDFERNPIEYRADEPTRQMLADMNVRFDGDVSVLFGDYWKSKKGGACFRPKPVGHSDHILVRCSWGGAFSRTRGIGCAVDGVYFRRAASNGGGAGYDYLVVPVGYRRVLHDSEVDGDGTPAVSDCAERAKAIRKTFVAFDAAKIAEAKANAKAKAEAEAASKAARESGLGTRLDAVNERLVALGHKLVELGEVSFEWGWQNQHYSEQAVASLEREVTKLEAEKSEQERKRISREALMPKFEAFMPRIEALGLSVEFEDDRVRFEEEYFGQPYSDQGILEFAADLRKREAQAANAKAKAEAEIAYQQRRTEAVALGLPSDVRIWCRRGGRTNAGDGWVVDRDGHDRDNTAWYNPRPRHVDEGDKVWEQILSGEVVIRWSKSSSAAPHEFLVVHMPAEGLTEAQLERIQEIQDGLESEWAGVRGFASGLPSPSVGHGWGLMPKPPVKADVRATAESRKRADLSEVDLSKLFGGDARVRR